MIKRALRFPLKLVWRAIKPLLRRLAARAETWIDPYITIAAESVADRSNMELDLAACEVSRLSRQIEAITATLHARTRP